MLEWIALENFRSFGQRSVAPIAPITLVYGPNSAGKSSLVKSLLMLKQSVLESRTGTFRYDGPFVDLGGPRAVVHRHDVANRIGVELGLGSIQHDQRSWDVSIEFAMSASSSVDDRITIHVSGDALTSAVTFRRSGPSHEFLRVADGESATALAHVAQHLSDGGATLFETPLEEPSALAAFHVDSLLPSTLAGRFTSARSSTITEMTPGSGTAGELAWSAFMESVIRSFRRLMHGVSYLGPLRRPWSRVEPIHPDGQIDGVGPTGEFSVNLLYRHPDLLSRVNRSLALLETGYSLEVRTLRSSEDSLVSEIVPEYLVPTLVHTQSGVAISPADAGFGLSQLLPLLVEAELRKQSTICIEQPELHLHPRLQARVGSVLRKAVEGGNQNRFVIETHSEHLLLRLQRLIREGLLKASSTLVIYIDNQEYDHDTERFLQSISSTMLTLRLAPNGDLLDPWPGGFFDERWDELGSWKPRPGA